LVLEKRQALTGVNVGIPINGFSAGVQLTIPRKGSDLLDPTLVETIKNEHGLADPNLVIVGVHVAVVTLEMTNASPSMVAAAHASVTRYHGDLIAHPRGLIDATRERCDIACEIRRCTQTVEIGIPDCRFQGLGLGCSGGCCRETDENARR
jgi:hypothetical protein